MGDAGGLGSAGVGRFRGAATISLEKRAQLRRPAALLRSRCDADFPFLIRQVARSPMRGRDRHKYEPATFRSSGFNRDGRPSPPQQL